MNTKVAKKNNKGFTLIELIVVIAIIAVLAAILAPQYLRYVEKSRVTADASTAKELKNAVQTACADDDVYSSLTANTATTVTWDKDGNIKVGNVAIAKPGTTASLSGELWTTFGGSSDGNTKPDVPKMKSKKWQAFDGGVYTLTITPNTDQATVTLIEKKPS